MLTLHRRHVRGCCQGGIPCRCPIYATGTLEGRKVRVSTKTANWNRAQEMVAAAERRGTWDEPVRQEIPDLSAALDWWISESAERVKPSTLRKVNLLAGQLREFAGVRLQSLGAWTAADAMAFRREWALGPAATGVKLRYLKSFFRFCAESGWMALNPAATMRTPRVDRTPTLPFSNEEMIAILRECGNLATTQGSALRSRLRPLVLLMRYSGLRISDAVQVGPASMDGDCLVARTAKTGASVRVPLPALVVDALRALPDIGNGYFWDGGSHIESAAIGYRRELAKAFKAAGIENGHPHRFRDTFAVRLLEAGVDIRTVSQLLGHSSVTVTERYYAPWTKGQSDRVEDAVRGTWGT